MSVATKKSLTPAQRWLLERMQRINHGWIYKLDFRNGQPVQTEEKRGKCSFRFGGENGAHEMTDAADFVLKKQHMELFDYMQRKQNGRIDELKIKYGLPFEMELDEE